MIRYSQIKNLDEILALDEYYALEILPDNEPEGTDNMLLGLLQVEGDTVVHEASTFYSHHPDDEENSRIRDGKLADRLTMMLNGSTVLAEPETLQHLRTFLDNWQIDAEIRFLPVIKFAQAAYQDPSVNTINDLMGVSGTEAIDTGNKLLDDLYVYTAAFESCRFTLSGQETAHEASAEDARDEKKKGRKKKPGKKRISNKTLHNWAEKIWSGSLWVLIVGAMILLFLFIRIVPHEKTTTVDRNVAPINYLVLSWDKTGKYGTRPRIRNGADEAIQFRIPYGVYNVLNNNSIPVEINVIQEGSEDNNRADAPQDTQPAEAQELSQKTEDTAGADNMAADEEEDTNSSVTLRPNSSRQITIDTDQYLTLSDDANELIFFYVSEVPEEKESDTTGQDTSNGRVVYAYVKGTEVRFRRAPSLEGQVIDSLNDGQQVQVLGVTGEWTHVSVQNQKGYIFSQFLTSEDPNAVAHVGSGENQEENLTGESTDQVDSPELTEETEAAEAENPADSTEAETAAVESVISENEA